MKPIAVLAAVATAILVLSNAVYAHPIGSAVQGGGERHDRFLRGAEASSGSHEVVLVGEGNVLAYADEEAVIISKGSLSGHAPHSADAGHDGKPPTQHHGHEKPKSNGSIPKNGTKADGPHLPPSGKVDHDSDHGHRYHGSSSSSLSKAGHRDAGDHAGVPPPPTKHHGDAKGGEKHPGELDSRPCGPDHQHHNAGDVGNNGKSSHVDPSKDVAHKHGHASDTAHAPHPNKNGVHSGTKGAKQSSAGAGSADAYLTKHSDAKSPHTSR